MVGGWSVSLARALYDMFINMSRPQGVVMRSRGCARGAGRSRLGAGVRGSARVHANCAVHSHVRVGGVAS
jgi:hypothetical protein